LTEQINVEASLHETERLGLYTATGD